MIMRQCEKRLSSKVVLGSFLWMRSLLDTNDVVCINAIETMSALSEGPRHLLITSAHDGSNGVHLTVRDSGTGLDPRKLEQAFDAFYTTKPDGMGMGLTVCRSIIEAHGGRLWATPNEPRGAVFQFTLPVGERECTA
jgi:signal transduction histidine kinase